MCCLYCRCCVEPESSQAWKVLFSLTAVFTLVHMMLDFHVTLPPFCCLRSNAGNVDISVSCRNKEDKCTWHDFFRNTSSGKWRAEMGVVRVYFILFEAGAIPAPILANHRTEYVLWVDHFRGHLLLCLITSRAVPLWCYEYPVHWFI